MAEVSNTTAFTCVFFRVRHSLVLAVTALLLALCFPVEAQQAPKLARIAYLAGAPLASNPARVDAFRQGLRELGYLEGKNIVIEWRSADGHLDRVNELAADVVRLNPHVIVTFPPSIRAVKKATSTIPIVMAFDNDPVENGYAQSLAHPAGNITGLSTLYPELSGKQPELMKEVIPKLSRLAVLGNSNESSNRKTLKEIEAAAAVLGVEVQYWDVTDSKGTETVFERVVKDHADAALVIGNTLFVSQRTHLAELASYSRIPVAYGRPEYVEAGGLMTYGPSITDLFRRAATYADKILKGARPGDLPIEQPKKFELIVNLKAAKQIGLTIPLAVLARADKVIK